MAQAPTIQENDLRPNQTHLLFQSPNAISAKALAALLKELLEMVKGDLDDPDNSFELVERQGPRTLGEQQLVWVVYSRLTPVTWATPRVGIADLEHHLAVLTCKGPFLSAVLSDKRLAAKLSRPSAAKEWLKLDRVPQRNIETALVHGSTRTLWLSGIHRSVATKADSKVLIGPDIEASLDALGDQTYHYTATRCEGPKDALPTRFVGVTPRQAKVWMGPSHDWGAFIAATQGLLGVVEQARASAQAPYPVLARAGQSVKKVMQAFDVSFAPPEYAYDEEDQTIEQLEEILQGATWAVDGSDGKAFALTVNLRDGRHLVDVSFPATDGEATHIVKPRGEGTEPLRRFLNLASRPEIFKVFYESLHTYSNGQFFEVRTRPIAFPLTPADFDGFDVAVEKPTPPGQPSTLDPAQIGARGDRSLFSWVWRRFRAGWLWCDDGSGEIADFIHLNPHSSELSLIHVKAANSASPNREVSVSAYEVVCSQALKNLRYIERAELERPLREKLENANADLVRGWHDGQPLQQGTIRFWRALEDVRYSELKHKVVVVQPHVRVSALPRDLTRDTAGVRRAKLLYTLLHGIKADVNRYSAEFEVIVSA